ncbi:arylsulfatase B-like [Lycorma delicatula]|uniref:arylsulfatase B-like n=1 Tax=Lycorma delicatula TaxID=130591 RepID=UPI003F517145
MLSIGLSCLIFLIFLIVKSELKAVKQQSAEKETYNEQPNIIFIIADDMGWNDVSFHGSDQIPTPNIDALAFNGVILNNHYVQPVCTPTRAALMTGKYPIHTGMQGSPLWASEKRGLPLEEKTIAEHLKELGYSTNIIGKWHLGYYKLDYTPLHRGFDSHIGYWNGIISYYDHIMEEPLEHSSYAGYDFKRNYTTVWEYQGKYATDIFTEEAVNVINNHNKEKPLFLYLGHLAVHAGNEGKWLEAPQETIDKFKHIPNPNRRTYAAMVSKLDDSVGQVLSALQQNEMLSNSIVVFLSDNGAPLSGTFKNWGSNQPFRGEKATLWEGGVRTAAVVWSTQIKKSSRVSKQLMHVTDWLPTLYTAAGGNESNLNKELDGINMWPSITKNKPSPRKQVVININEINNYGAIVVRKDNKECGTVGTYKIIVGKPPNKAINNIQYLEESSLTKPYNVDDVLSSKANKAIKQVTDKQVNDTIIKSLRNEATIVCTPAKTLSECEDICLFDLDSDPCEQTDISESQNLLTMYMRDIYSVENKTVVPQLPSLLDSAANPALFNYTWSAWESPSQYHILDNSDKLT